VFSHLQLLNSAMNNIFRQYLDTLVFVSLDYIIIFPQDPSKHAEHLTIVLDILHNHNYSTRLQKCYFAEVSIEFLGHVISEKNIDMDPTFTPAINQNSDPTSGDDSSHNWVPTSTSATPITRKRSVPQKSPTNISAAIDDQFRLIDEIFPLSHAPPPAMIDGILPLNIGHATIPAFPEQAIIVVTPPSTTIPSPFPTFTPTINQTSRPT
jgi:hypothetical protein